jgi:hypothetical protein
MQPEQIRFESAKPSATGSVREVIFGDETKPGMYLHRVKFPKNYLTRPHFHNSDRWVLVMKGTWYTAEGRVFNPSTMIPIKTGGMMYHPGNLIHYDGTRDEEVIVQIMGLGPVTTTRVEEDGKKQ